MNSGSSIYERGYINRSYKIAVIKCKYVTSDLKKVRTGIFEIPVKTLNQTRIIKALSRQEKNIYILKVIHMDIKRYLYSMSEETFMKHAESRKEIE